MVTEVLAPAGGREQLIAAVRSGADAVYLGTNAFNARRNAENFDTDYLRNAVAYCHGRGVKVYVTLNTLVKDSELRLVYSEIEHIAGSGADAVIVQDMAVAEMLRRHCPSMPMHASTQLVIHNSEGAQMAKELGFSRVVLARELSLEEIRKICSEVEIEVEIFVHGALCMSVSGACYISSFLGERSGNRGLCAQPCRLDFRSGNRPYALSLKDLSYIEHMSELVESGVCSLKIEGRMKRPEYVSAAVLACRKALAGEKPDLSRLRAVFSRSGFTDGYLSGKRDLDMFGHRTKDDVQASASVLGELASNYRNELARVPVMMSVKIKEGMPSVLNISDGKFDISVSGDIPEKAVTRGTNIDDVRRSLEKTGGTPFKLDKLQVELDDSVMLPQSKMKAMRRRALEKLLKVRSEPKPKEFQCSFTFIKSEKRTTIPKMRLRFERKNQIFDAALDADRIYLPIDEIDRNNINLLGEKLICELPRLVFPLKEKSLEERLIELKQNGLKNVSAGNLGTMGIAKRLGFQVHGSFDLNILNSESLMKYENMGLSDTMLSIEINHNDAMRLGGGIERGIIGYGYLPLMVFRNCPAKSERGCGKCDGAAAITDRTGTRFRIICGGREYSSLLNSIPLYIGDKNIMGVDFVTLYYTVEDAYECKTVWGNWMSGEAYHDKFTRALYYRNLK